MAAASLLLAACGTEKSDGEALPRSQANAVLPGPDAMSGWEVAAEPSTTTSKGAYSSKVCPGDTSDACEGVHSYGTAQYTRGKTLASSFQVISYTDETSADAAYEELWERRGVIADSRDLDFGKLGEEGDARAGKGGSGDTDAAVFQVRVGALILFGTAGSRTPEVRLDEATVKQLAVMFSKRAEEAAAGDEPSARLRGR